MVFKDLHHLGDGRTVLPNRAVDTNQVVALVVDDGVQNDSGLAGLAIANDEFALAAANGNHGINGLDAGGHGFAHRLAVNHAWRQPFNVDVLAGGDGAFIVNGLAQRIHYAADHSVARGNGHDASGALYLVTFFYFRVFA